MTALLRFGFVARSTPLAVIASLLLAAGCSAPSGDDTGDDALAEFGGTPPAPGAAGAPVAMNTPSPSAPGTAPASPATPAPAGAPSEQTGSNIGLQPTPPGNPGGSQNGSGNAGAGGSSMVGAEPGAGAGGSSFDPNAGSAGGATSMPAPTDGNPQQPQQPQPVTPAPGADCGGAFFCDDFEGVAAGASPDPAQWSIMVNYSETQAAPNVQVSAANAHSGGQALRVTPAGRAGILATVPQSSYFIRAFMQLDAVPLGPVFIGAGTEANNETRFRIQGQSFAVINSVGSPQGDAVRPAAATSGNCPECLTLRANEWLCVEMSIDSSTSTATLWINGTEAAVADPAAFAPQPANPTVFLGTMDVQGNSSAVWIDDVAIGPTRIGCN